jgi:hypothetical protein
MCTCVVSARDKTRPIAESVEGLLATGEVVDVDGLVLEDVAGVEGEEAPPEPSPSGPQPPTRRVSAMSTVMERAIRVASGT